MSQPTGPGWPDLDEYKEWSRSNKPGDTTDDAAIDQALSAVKSAILQRSVIWLNNGACPEDLAYCVLLWTNRLLVRRQSPEGIVGIADLGVVSIAKADADIRQMLNPWLEPVIA